MYLLGYTYRKAASFRTTTDWVCVCNELQHATNGRCLARLVQRMEDGALKLNRHLHNHAPEEKKVNA